MKEMLKWPNPIFVFFLLMKNKQYFSKIFLLVHILLYIFKVIQERNNSMIQ